MALIPPAPLGAPFTSYTWADWYEKVRREINAGATVDLAGAQVTGVLPVIHGGTGTTTPSLVAGSNVTVTGTWPNQTVAATSSGPSTFSYWNPSHIATNVAYAIQRLLTEYRGLSVLTYTGSGLNTQTVLGTKSITVGAGDYMFEIQCDADSAFPSNHLLGVVDSGFTSGTMNSFVGNDVHGYGFYSSSGAKYNNGASAIYSSAYHTSVTARDYIGVRVDASGNLIFYVNGVSAGTAFTIAGGTVLYPAYSSGSSSGARRVILNTGFSTFAFPIGGVTAWG